MTYRLFTTCFLAGALAFSACDDDDDPTPVNEEEVITTATLTLSPAVGGGIPVMMSFRDLDGDGGNAPIITGGTLAANISYNYTLVLLNEQATPAENITTEVEEEGDEHQFFFRPTGVNLSHSYGDVDENSRPIGITGTLTAGAASTGTLTVTLRHEPNKTAEGVLAGNITNAGGETDIEVIFPVTVR